MKKTLLILLLTILTCGMVAEASGVMGADLSIGFTDGKPGKNRIGLTDFYPNPANTTIYADYNMPANVKTAKIVISNVLGSKIEEIELGRADKQITINTTDYTGGVYILTLYVDGVSETSKRLIVKH